jgi:hypothetical protein
VKRLAFAVAVMTTHQRDEPSPTFDKFSLDSALPWMICKWEGRQRLNPSDTIELLDPYLDCSVPEDRTIEVPVSAGEIIVFHLELINILLTSVEDDASIPLGTETSSVEQVVRFEEGPDKIIRNLTMLQQWNKSLSGGQVGLLDVADQKVKVLKLSQDIISTTIDLSPVCF